MHTYEHKQPGTLIRVWVGIWVVVFLLLALTLTEGKAVFAGVAAILVVVLAVFHSLTVRISSNDMAISFGTGLIQKRFVLAEIQLAKIVRNRWYHGWGVKRFYGGWLFNVSGFDAVEIQLRNGRRYRIGTDEPHDLLQAIELACPLLQPNSGKNHSDNR